MTLTQVWGSLVIFIVTPLLGGLPLISWITFALTKKRLQQLGTGNISVSAAFYHGGTLVGICAVISEALKGIAAVLIARAFFPTAPVWELIALIALVMGRYWMGKGAGTTNVVWGIVVHDPITALFVFLIGGISFTIFRNRNSGRLVILFLLSFIVAMRYPDEAARVAAAITLSALIAWIYYKIPDDLELPETEVQPKSSKMFRFFRGDAGIISLDNQLDALKVGNKAANLSQLKHWGYAVPPGWVLLVGDDLQALIQTLQPSPTKPFVVRSSALAEDSLNASAAGMYQSILNINSPEAMKAAIVECFASYNSAAATQYRQDRNLPDTGMALLIQQQIQGAFSGVAFSRDPINQLNSAVVIEALPGNATQVVSGQVTPQQYKVYFHEDNTAPTIEGSGDLPPGLLQEVAQIAREIEDIHHGIPQDLEWTYDGQQLWLLQARPITTLQPIWTRKIAAEVIPGAIKPLTWSINRPLTCGVWGDIFTLVLGSSAQDLDFEQTATLHYSHAYFNATLLGEIFRRMGLPPESLEFLTRGAKMSRPSFVSTLRNIPGLVRLLRREWHLIEDFDQDYQTEFAPLIGYLHNQRIETLTSGELLQRIDRILQGLKKATYYSILAPLSFALRQAILSVDIEALDNSQTPEVASLQALARLAQQTRQLLPKEPLPDTSAATLFNYLATHPQGTVACEKFDWWLERYGYLGEAATDIAVPRWQEDPQNVKALFAQYLFNEQLQGQPAPKSTAKSWKTKAVQKRLQLKGQATEVYSQLLAHLRWSFLSLGKILTQVGTLTQAGDIFTLQLTEINNLIEKKDSPWQQKLPELLTHRHSQFQQDSQLTYVPQVVYGSAPLSSFIPPLSSLSAQQQLQGIAASPGQVRGKVKILRTLQSVTNLEPGTILVVPYTDSGWSPVLSLASGIIAEVGGRLSHGAIVAREYGIPAVMDIHHATQILQEGQQVSIDGSRGLVEVLADSQ